MKYTLFFVLFINFFVDANSALAIERSPRRLMSIDDIREGRETLPLTLRNQVLYEFNCPLGGSIQVFNGEDEIEVICGSGMPEKKDEPKNDTQVNLGDDFEWALGAGGFYLSVNGGPSGGGIEAAFEGRLAISETMKFIFILGPGAAFLDGHDTAPAVSEFVGFEWATNSWFNIAAGLRHRAIFDGSGDLINGLDGGLRFRAELSPSVSLSFGGGYGTAWFSSEKPQDAVWPGGVTPPTIITREDGGAWGIGLNLAFEH